jgi:hypothetical protein
VNNPLEMIKVLCKEEDFVMFKLDIDTPSVELPIMVTQREIERQREREPDRRTD